MGSYSSQFLQRVTNILHVECCLKKLSRAFRECMKQKGSEESVTFSLVFGEKKSNLR